MPTATVLYLPSAFELAKYRLGRKQWGLKTEQGIVGS